MKAIARSCACQSLKEYATASAGVSKALYGNVWASPSVSKVQTLTTAVVGALFGGSGTMRCAETVLGILYDPCSADPAAAMPARRRSRLGILLDLTKARLSAMVLLAVVRLIA